MKKPSGARRTTTSSACDDESPEACDPSGQEPTTRKKGGKTGSTGDGAPRFLRPRFFRLSAFRKKRARVRLRFPEFHFHEYPEYQFRAAKTHLKAIRRTARRARTFTATERAAARHMLVRDDSRRDQHKKDAGRERRQHRRDKETHRARHWRPNNPTP